MKLPPLALTAPSLCPRCDAPALFVDECNQCALPIRQCGACLGVAGPFDRYCGFCGHELVLGTPRSNLRRLWLLVALIPIAAGLALGLSPVGQQAVRGAVSKSSVPPATRPNLVDRAVGFTASSPRAWTHQDSTQSGRPFAAVLSDQADAPAVAGSPSSLVTATPKGPVIEVGRASISDPGVDASDPVAVLAFETAQLLGSPPPGYSVTTLEAVRAVNIGGRVAARTELSLIGSGGTTYVLEKVYISSPSGGLVLVEALTPPAQLPAVRSFVDSIRLTR